MVLSAVLAATAIAAPVLAVPRFRSVETGTVATSIVGAEVSLRSAEIRSTSVRTDRRAIVAGVVFQATGTGMVTGVRVYKKAGTAGPQEAYLLTPDSRVVARAAFRNESASGWQTARFEVPVALQPNVNYLAAYSAPSGQYAVGESSRVRTRIDQSSPLVLRGSVFGRGTVPGVRLHRRSADYLVDVTFRPGDTSMSSPSVTDVADGVDPSPTGTSVGTAGEPGPTTPAVVTTSTTPASRTSTTTTSTTTIPTAAPTTSSTSPSASSNPPRTSTTTAPPSGSTCRTAVWQNLERCGWPGPANTGPAASTAVQRTVTGGLVITTNGTVVDGWRVDGGIQVRARNVVIRNSWVSHSAGGANGSGVVNINPGASATIVNSLLDGKNATHTCIWHEGASMVARTNECRGANDGIFTWATTTGVDGAGDNFTIEDNYLHGFTTAAANGHVDAFQTEGAKHGVIRHNTFDVAQDQTSAIAIWNSRKSADDIVVDRNLIAGGGFAVYAEDYNPSEASPAGGYSVTRIRFSDNVFSTVHYPCVGNWGVWFSRGAPTDGWSRSGNAVLETGQNVDGGNPTYQGRVCN